MFFFPHLVNRNGSSFSCTCVGVGRQPSYYLHFKLNPEALSRPTDWHLPLHLSPRTHPQACDKTSVCIGNVNPHASPVFHSVCKPGRRAPKFSQPFCCATEPAQRLICSVSWAALVSAGWLNRDRRASAHPVKPFNPVNGKKARRLYKPSKPLRRAKD